MGVALLNEHLGALSLAGFVVAAAAVGLASMKRGG